MNLVTGEVLAQMTGLFGNHWDTFARHTIVVNKEPIINVVSNECPLPGYSVTSNPDNYTNIPVSGTFNVVRVYKYSLDGQDIVHSDIKTTFANIPVRIKVQEDCKDYIINGKTLNIQLEGQIYNQISMFKVQDYFGLRYYYFDLLSSN